jgi:hypothetical protein
VLFGHDQHSTYRDQEKAGMKSIALISVYMGPLPGWLPIWLNSCALNDDIDFYLITDHPDEIPYLPANLQVVTMSLREICDRFSRAVGFNVELPQAYKICDFRPLFGHAFQDIIHGSDFWGHVDMDMFFGRLRHFLTDERLEKYVKLYVAGHLSLFRNDDRGNNLYLLPNRRLDWRTVFTTPLSCHFDERHGIYQTVLESGLPFYENNSSVADIVPSSPRIQLTNVDQNTRHQAFVFDDGRVLQIFLQDGKVCEREFIYLHFQKRSLPALSARSWQDIRQWVFTAHGAYPNLPRIWDEKSMAAANKPNILHLYQFYKRKLTSNVKLWKHPLYSEVEA